MKLEYRDEEKRKGEGIGEGSHVVQYLSGLDTRHYATEYESGRNQGLVIFIYPDRISLPENIQRYSNTATPKS